jgi:hypothetical protein
VLSLAVLAENFPRELAGPAIGALDVFHIGAAFVLQYATGVVLRPWMPPGGHYPEVRLSGSIRTQRRPSDNDMGLVRSARAICFGVQNSGRGRRIVIQRR